MSTDGEKAVVTEYTKVDDEVIVDVKRLKGMAAAYYDAIVVVEDKHGYQRDFSLAKTKVQEASMWVTRGLTNPEGDER